MINNKKVFAIIMAGGKGTRIGATDKPKVMFEVAGKPIIGWAIEPFLSLKKSGIIDRIITIVGFCGDKVIDYLADKSEFVWQREQLGTAHAVRMAENLIMSEDGITLIVNGDHPLYSKETFSKLLDKFTQDDLTLAFAVVKSKTRFNDYGRVVRGDSGLVSRVVEVPEATPEQLEIDEKSINLYAVDNKWLFEALPKIRQSEIKKEYYIVDIVKMAIDEGKKVEAVEVEHEDEALGINTLVDRDEVEQILTSKP
jgi:bifunctional UDP-N-acetylglucosamine pyrophosphorylase/glucosamine-1-phosphate N-acetyltransferase